jgi:UMF1 family MFS transporter
MSPASDTTEPQQGAPRSALFSWCLYDWANSAFPTVIITFVFATYFTTAVAETSTGRWERPSGAAPSVHRPFSSPS